MQVAPALSSRQYRLTPFFSPSASFSARAPISIASFSFPTSTSFPHPDASFIMADEVYDGAIGIDLGMLQTPHFQVPSWPIIGRTFPDRNS